MVNAIIDAAYRSAESKLWEKVELPVWRGQEGLSKESHLTDYDEQHYLIKEEMTHDGRRVVLLKEKASGQFVEKQLN